MRWIFILSEWDEYLIDSKLRVNNWNLENGVIGVCMEMEVGQNHTNKYVNYNHTNKYVNGV